MLLYGWDILILRLILLFILYLVQSLEWLLKEFFVGDTEAQLGIIDLERSDKIGFCFVLVVAINNLLGWQTETVYKY